MERVSSAGSSPLNDVSNAPLPSTADLRRRFEKLTSPNTEDNDGLSSVAARLRLASQSPSKNDAVLASIRETAKAVAEAHAMKRTCGEATMQTMAGALAALIEGSSTEGAKEAVQVSGVLAASYAAQCEPFVSSWTRALASRPTAANRPALHAYLDNFAVVPVLSSLADAVPRIADVETLEIFADILSMALERTSTKPIAHLESTVAAAAARCRTKNVPSGPMLLQAVQVHWPQTAEKLKAASPPPPTDADVNAKASEVLTGTGETADAEACDVASPAEKSSEAPAAEATRSSSASSPAIASLASRLAMLKENSPAPSETAAVENQTAPSDETGSPNEQSETQDTAVPLQEETDAPSDSSCDAAGVAPEQHDVGAETVDPAPENASEDAIPPSPTAKSLSGVESALARDSLSFETNHNTVETGEVPENAQEEKVVAAEQPAPQDEAPQPAQPEEAPQPAQPEVAPQSVQEKTVPPSTEAPQPAQPEVAPEEAGEEHVAQAPQPTEEQHVAQAPQPLQEEPLPQTPHPIDEEQVTEAPQTVHKEEAKEEVKLPEALRPSPTPTPVATAAYCTPKQPQNSNDALVGGVPSKEEAAPAGGAPSAVELLAERLRAIKETTPVKEQSESTGPGESFEACASSLAAIHAEKPAKLDKEPRAERMSTLEARRITMGNVQRIETILTSMEGKQTSADSDLERIRQELHRVKGGESILDSDDMPRFSKRELDESCAAAVAETADAATQLASEYEALEKRHKALRQETADLRAALSDTHKIAIEAAQQSDANAARALSAETKVRELENHIQGVEKAFKALHDRYSGLKARATTLEENEKSLREAASKNEEIIRENRASWNAMAKDFEEKIATKEKEVQSANEDIAKARSDLESLQLNHSALEKSYNSATDKLSVAEREIELYRQKNALLQKELEANKANVHSLVAASSQTASEREAAERKLGEREAELGARAREAEAAAAAARSEVQREAEARKAIEQSVQAVRKELESAQEQNKQLMAEMAKKDVQNKELTKICDELLARLSAK